MDLAHENGRSNEHLDLRLELFDEIGSSKCRSEGTDVDLMDVDKDSDHSYILNPENTEPVRPKPEIVDGDDGNHSAKRLEASSSSSSDSSLDDLCQVDTSQDNISLPRTSIHQEAQPASKIDENSGTSPLNMQDNSPGPTSTSQFCEVSQQAEIQGLPLTLNPPTQVMDRSGGYDPNRIPSSVFAENPETPMDWSLASNESLFSIHVGDSSFSRDTKFSLDGLGKPEELMMFKELPKSDELSLYSPTFHVSQMDNDEQKNDKMENEFGTTGRGGETVTEQPTESEQQTEVKRKRSGVTWKFSNLSGPSDGSGNSGKSFAFPILSDGGKNSSSKAYIERYYSESPMQTTSSSTDGRCCSCCSCCCCCSCSCYSSCPSCFYFRSCRSCFLFFKSISCSHYC